MLPSQWDSILLSTRRRAMYHIRPTSTLYSCAPTSTRPSQAALCLAWRQSQRARQIGEPPATSPLTNCLEFVSVHFVQRLHWPDVDRKVLLIYADTQTDRLAVRWVAWTVSKIACNTVPSTFWWLSCEASSIGPDGPHDIQRRIFSNWCLVVNTPKISAHC